MLSDDAEEIGEHAHIGSDSGPDVAGHEDAERTLERGLVELFGSLNDLQQRVVQRRRIATIDGDQQPLQPGPKPGVDPSNGAEVEQGELSIGEQQHVARMRIGVEDAIDHHLAEQSVEQGASECLAVTDLLIGRDCAQWAALEPLHHEHMRGTQGLMRFRYPDRRGGAPRACRGGHGDHVLGLDPQVEFLPERRREPVRKVDRADSPPPARAGLEAPRQSIDDVQIPRHGGVDPRPANLHDHPLTGFEHGSVHLRDRGGRE
jgi:hypothetical protein